MRTFFLITICLFIVITNSFCQCTQPGLKIQSPVCDTPRNLMVDSLAPAAMYIKWSGKKLREYIVTAFYSDPATNTEVKAKVSPVTCDSNNCSAIIFVKEGIHVKWSVEAVCLVENASINSAAANGESTYVPSPIDQNKNMNIDEKGFNVYPNPSPGYLIIYYPVKIDGDIKFRIFDATGKQVFSKLESININASRYRLEIQNLVNGVYLLEINNGTKVNSTTFELLKK